MAVRLKMLSAATAIGLAIAAGGAQAAELLSDETLDTVSAGAVAAAAQGNLDAVAQAVQTCATCTITDGIVTMNANGSSRVAQAFGADP
jgi:hypothetical protein